MFMLWYFGFLPFRPSILLPLTLFHSCPLPLFLTHSSPVCLLSDGIVGHLKKQAGPASVEIKTVAEFEKYAGGRDASIVGKWLQGPSLRKMS